MFKNSFGYLVKEGLHNIRANRQMSGWIEFKRALS